MQGTVETIGAITIFTPTEDHLAVDNVRAFKDRVTTYIDVTSQSVVVLDMSQLLFVDSSGIGALVEMFKLLRAAGGDLKLCGIVASIRELFELVQAEKIFDIFTTKEEAVDSMQAHVARTQTVRG